MIDYVHTKSEAFKDAGELPLSIALLIAAVVIIVIAVTPGHVYLKAVALAYVIFP